MKSFNVIWWDFNKPAPEPYDVIPYLVDCYIKARKKPKTVEEFTKFVKDESMYMWWSRTQYEIIICDWPSMKYEKKWDIHKQVMMNIEHIVSVFMEAVSEITKNKTNKH